MDGLGATTFGLPPFGLEGLCLLRARARAASRRADRLGGRWLGDDVGAARTMLAALARPRRPALRLWNAMVQAVLR